MTETETIPSEAKLSEDRNKRKGHQIVRSNVAFLAVIHIMALYGIYLMPAANPRTWIWTWLCYVCGGLGVTCRPELIDFGRTGHTRLHGLSSCYLCYSIPWLHKIPTLNVQETIAFITSILK